MEIPAPTWRIYTHWTRMFSTILIQVWIWDSPECLTKTETWKCNLQDNNTRKSGTTDACIRVDIKCNNWLRQESDPRALRERKEEKGTTKCGAPGYETSKLSRLMQKNVDGWVSSISLIRCRRIECSEDKSVQRMTRWCWMKKTTGQCRKKKSIRWCRKNKTTTVLKEETTLSEPPINVEWLEGVRMEKNRRKS